MKKKYIKENKEKTLQKTDIRDRNKQKKSNQRGKLVVMCDTLIISALVRIRSSGSFSDLYTAYT